MRDNYKSIRTATSLVDQFYKCKGYFELVYIIQRAKSRDMLKYCIKFMEYL